MTQAAANPTNNDTLLTKIKVFLDLIKFEHTIFALPFAYLGTVLAAGGLPTFHQFFWVTLAMASARTLAFAINRLADRRFDATNPRTAKRPSVTGRLSSQLIIIFAVISLVVLAVSAALLSPLALILFPGALVFLLGYSYTKRFTALCHWVLGFTDGLAAIGGWIAVRGSIFTADDLPAWLLMFAVTFWIGGFDLIYACQDVEHDKQEGLYSWPSRYGIASALFMAKANHVLTILVLIVLGLTYPLGWPYWIGVAIAAALLAYENSLVKPNDLSKMNQAFFQMNSYVAVTLFVGTFLALVI
ncbi:MAG: putative 4-hydroxybenzoate polyprenyltransferase [Chloroflexi bacterium]|nr:putative 4-hydroxybenzoate polyprenyltransferase [Chloroflexota bacterium]MCC6893820.1 UbiA family prenyltransferase [Anaerolineae bacterium]